MQARNLIWVNADSTLIDMIVTHPRFGEIPFTASPHDVEPHGRELFARAVAGDFGPVAEYVPPPSQDTTEPTPSGPTE